jgi:hypothetical protein
MIPIELKDAPSWGDVISAAGRPNKHNQKYGKKVYFLESLRFSATK